MEEINLLNPNFFFLKDNYDSLYDKCKNMDLAIVNEKYNASVIASNSILHELLKTIAKSEDGDLDKLLDRVCKLNTTASEIGLYLREIRANGKRAINNSRRFSKSKAIKNAEMVYEVTSYFLYAGLNPLEPYQPPQYYDDWVKKEIADIRDLEEYLADFNEKTHEEEFTESKPQTEGSREKSEGSSKKIVIKVKTEKTPEIRLIMKEDMVDEFKPVIEIDYFED